MAFPFGKKSGDEPMKKKKAPPSYSGFDSGKSGKQNQFGSDEPDGDEAGDESNEREEVAVLQDLKQKISDLIDEHISMYGEGIAE